MATRLIHIGVGGRGKWPVNLVPQRDDYESVAFVDINEENMNAAMDVAGMPESKCFRTLEQALNNVESDAVVVITPPDLHAEMCLEAVRAGKHVLVEKPFTKNLATAIQVVEEAEKHGVKVGVSQNAKYNAATVTLRRLIQEEVYGKANFGQMTKLSWRSKGVHHSGEDDHSYLWERGIHDFDTMRFAFADTPKKMWGKSFNPSWSPYKGGAGVHAWIEFEGGATCGYLCCFEAHKSESSFRIDVDEGTLYLSGRSISLSRRNVDEDEAIPLDECLDSTTVIMNKFAKYINDDVEPEFAGKNNLTTVALVEGLGVSSDEGRIIDVKEYLTQAGA